MKQRSYCTLYGDHDDTDEQEHPALLHTATQVKPSQQNKTSTTKPNHHSTQLNSFIGEKH